MRNKLFLLVVMCCGLLVQGTAQELQARISINSSRVSSQTDKKIFQTLQNSLNTFLNNRKWTNEPFQANEKIVCHFLINISEAVGGNVYRAGLTVQAARIQFEL
jgi:hypothetical protein